MKKTPFVPSKLAAKLAKFNQMRGKLTATGFDPASVNLTPAQVTQLGTLVDAAQADYDAREALRETKKANTTRLSGPGGSMDQLTAHGRLLGNLIRVSDASNDVCTDLGVSRRDGVPTKIPAPTSAPELALEKLGAGTVRLRFRQSGSASPRGRANNTQGVLLAMVDAANAAVAGEADKVPTAQCPRSPVDVDTTGWPAKVRLYACWVTARGLTGPWSTPLAIGIA